MMEDEPEDDVLFDQAGLLSKKVKPMKKITGRAPVGKGNQRLVKTLCLCAAFFGLGLCISVPGPTLNALQEYVNVGSDRIGIIFTGRSVGYLAGSFIGGQLFDKVNQYMLMSVALFFTGIATISAPFSRRLILLVGLISVQGITMGFLDTGGNVVCVNLWGQHSGPYMQAMHFSFGIGAFIAPLVAEPFLCGNDSKCIHPNSMTSTSAPTAPKITLKGTSAPTSPKTTLNGTGAPTTPKTTKSTSAPTTPKTTKSTSAPTTPKTTPDTQRRRKRATGNAPNASLVHTVTEQIKKVQKFQFAFVTIGVLVLLISFLFIAVSCCGKQQSQAVRNSEMPGQILKKESNSFRRQIMIMLFVFYFLYVGMEVTYGGLCAKFAMEKYNWTAKEAAYLTAVFWGSFAFSRLVAIFLARISATVILIADLAITLLSMIGLVMFIDYNDYVVWVCSSTLGIGMASIFPTGLIWAESYMEITGRAASVFVVGSALGEMVIPFATAYAMSHVVMSLMYILLALTFVAGSLFIALQRVASSQGVRYQKVGMAHRTSHPKPDTALEMEGHSEAFASTSNASVSAGPNRRNKPTFKSGGKGD